MSIAIVSHPDCALHDLGQGHPEQPARVQVIQNAIKHYPFTKTVKFYDAPLATREQLLRAHDRAQVDWIISIAPKQGFIAIDADTIMNKHTLDAALRAAGAVPFAVDLVMQGKADVAFCNVRPPGHHAEFDKAMGFCFFNNVAVGAAYAMAEYHLERIAIIDFDVHRGNGTQEIFHTNKHILYCSSFQHPFYPGYEEESDDAQVLSIPMAAGTNGAAFRHLAEKIWFDKLVKFKPQLIFFSAGFDAHQDDPLADLNFTEADYVWLTEQVAKIAKQTCAGKIVSVLEGGYNLEVLAQCVPAHINAMV